MSENQKHQFAFDRIFADDSLATARRYLSADNIVKIIKHVEAAMWRPIETLGGGEKDYVLARTADGRVMQMRASMLARNLKGPTPDHLSFPAIQWMPAPISATLKPEFPMSDAIQQERDRLARILEAEALKRSPLTRQTERVAALEEALKDATAHLAAATSVYQRFCRKGVTGDALYTTRLKDFKAAIHRAHSTLKESQAPTK